MAGSRSVRTGTLYVPFFGDPSGGVRALDPATGATRWTVTVAEEGDDKLPAVAGDGTIHLPAELSLYAIDRNGNVLWVFPVGDFIGGVALGGDGTIYVTTRDENLTRSTATAPSAGRCRSRWRRHGHAIGADGTLYFATSTGLTAVGCAGGSCAACVPNCAGRRCGPDGSAAYAALAARASAASSPRALPTDRAARRRGRVRRHARPAGGRALARARPAARRASAAAQSSAPT